MEENPYNSGWLTNSRSASSQLLADYYLSAFKGPHQCD